jgi:hypothetical protein
LEEGVAVQLDELLQKPNNQLDTTKLLHPAGSIVDMVRNCRIDHSDQAVIHIAADNNTEPHTHRGLDIAEDHGMDS